MKKKNRSNLLSPCQLQGCCLLDALEEWFRQELLGVPKKAEREILTIVFEDLSDFVAWPEKAILLWEGRDRSHKYHKYPATIRLMALTAKVPLDGRVNGPAVAAYRIAGGKRPPRAGSNNGWSIHHIYSGKFPHIGKLDTLHAAHDGKHCSQSAGLVAVHPIADQLCDEYPAFAWLLRALSFQKFGYDPDHVFSQAAHDQYGFSGQSCFVVPPITQPVDHPSAQQRP